MGFLLTVLAGCPWMWGPPSPRAWTAWVSVLREAQEAGCWQPVPFPQLWSGILPALPSLRGGQERLRPLAVPVSADSRGTVCESRISPRFLQLPWGCQACQD